MKLAIVAKKIMNPGLSPCHIPDVKFVATIAAVDGFESGPLPSKRL